MAVADACSNGQLESMARPLLAGSVNRWLVWGDVRPWLVFQDGVAGYESRLRLATIRALGKPSFGLFGVLGLQLAAAVSASSHAVCDGCHRGYRPERTPAARRNHFCATCRKDGTADRIRLRRWRQRKH
jgi:hypothetical protein